MQTLLRFFVIITLFIHRNHIVNCFRGFQLVNNNHFKKFNNQVTFATSDESAVQEFKKLLIESIESFSKNDYGDKSERSLPDSTEKMSTEVVVPMTWKQIQKKCQEIMKSFKLKPFTGNTFPFRDGITYLMENGEYLNKVISVVDDDSNTVQLPVPYISDNDEYTYVTENELRRLWNREAARLQQSKMKTFSIKDALLLVEDEFDTYLMEPLDLHSDELPAKIDESTVVLDTTALGEIEKSYSVNQVSDEDIIRAVASREEPELFITEQELEQAWRTRWEFKWGEPCINYTTMNGLLYLCDDYEGDFELGSPSGKFIYQAASEAIPSVQEPWESVDDPKTKDTIRRIFEELDSKKIHRPAWKKGSNMLTPDIETQYYEGNMMFGNTYLTVRVPANWDDEEDQEMSSAYQESKSMAWPGEPETDYNKKTPIWELLQIDLEKKPKAYDSQNRDPLQIPVERFNELYKQEQEQLLRESTISMESIQISSDVSQEKVNWETFDFGSLSGDSNADPSTSSPSTNNESSDIDSFYKNLLTKSSKDDSLPGSKRPLENEEEEEEEGEVELIPGKTILQFDTPDDSNFKTPPEWLEKWKNDPNGFEYVGYDVWSKYDTNEYVKADEKVWVDDILIKLSVERIQNLTSFYLRDMAAEDRSLDEVKYLQKILNLKLIEYYERHGVDIQTAFNDGNVQLPKNSNEGKVVDLHVMGNVELDPLLLDPVPLYLTPNLNKGVNYTSTIMEMKSKKILEPQPDDPQVAYKDDIFEPNEDLMAANRVGTIRVQYDWLPQPPPEGGYLIEDHVVEKIRPVLNFLNHVAELKSTKNNVILFNYKGTLRHVIGLTEMTKNMALQYFPELKDLRLETNRLADKVDYQG